MISIASLLQERLQPKPQELENFMFRYDRHSERYKVFKLDLEASTTLVGSEEEFEDGSEYISKRLHALCRVEDIDHFDGEVMISTDIVRKVENSSRFKDKILRPQDFGDVFLKVGEKMVVTPIRFLGFASNRHTSEIKNLSFEDVDRGEKILKFLEKKDDEERSYFEKSWTDFLEGRGYDRVSISEASDKQHTLFAGGLGSFFHSQDAPVFAKAIMLEQKDALNAGSGPESIVFGSISSQAEPSYNIPIGGRDPDEYYEKLISAAVERCKELEKQIELEEDFEPGGM